MGTYSKRLLEKIFNKDDNFCYYCKRDYIEGRFKTKDHILAIARGGRKRNSKNIVYCCNQCNAGKGGKTLEGWRKKLIKQRDYSQFEETRELSKIRLAAIKSLLRIIPPIEELTDYDDALQEEGYKNYTSEPEGIEGIISRLLNEEEINFHEYEQ